MSHAHYLVVTTGSAGDLFPFLKLADGLRQRGLPVTLVAPALHAPLVRQSGLDFHGIFADPATLADPDLWHPRRGFAIVWRAVRPGLKELLPLVQALPPGPCVIVAHPLALPEAELCRTVRDGVRVAVAYLAPSNIASVHDPLVLGPWKVPRLVPHALRRWLWRQIGTRMIDPVVLPDMNIDRARHALPAVDGLFDFMVRAPDLSLTLFPSWFGPPQPDWPHALVCGQFALHDPDPAAAFPAELAAFLAAGSGAARVHPRYRQSPGRAILPVRARGRAAARRAGDLPDAAARAGAKPTCPPPCCGSRICRSPACCRRRRRWCTTAASAARPKRCGPKHSPADCGPGL
ncbi:glycosyltransferase [Massilia sp. B-10]|nr:glycosyltransferase [Massilia sp. B-10]